MTMKDRLTLRVVVSLWLVALLLANVILLGMPGRQAKASSQPSHGLRVHEVANQSPSGTAVIRGRVTHASNDVPIGDANVWAEPYGGEPGGDGAMSDASGYYTITVEAGTYRVGANKEWYAVEFYEDTLSWDDATQVVVGSGGTVSDINFSLDPAGIITGTVKNADSTAAITTAQIGVNAADDSWGTGTDQIDSTGVYTIFNVLQGQYTVEAWAPGYVREYYEERADWESADEVTVVAGQVAGAIDFTLSQAGIIIGQVCDAQGNPIDGADVHAEPYGEGAGGDHTQSGASGHYTLTVAAGTYRINAGKTLYVTEFYSDTLNREEAAGVAANEGVTTSGVNFFLDPAGLISGTVRDPDGGLVQQAHVFVHDFQHQFHEGTESDEQGGFIISVPPGTYKLEVDPPEGSPWASPEEIVVDVPAAGETVLVGNVSLARPVLTGKVTAPDGVTPIPWVWVEAHTQNWSVHQGGSTDQDGVFRIGGLPDGMYTLEARAPDSGEGAQYSGSIPQAVQVIAGQTTDVGIVPLTQRQIYGRVTLPDGSTPVPHTWVEARSIDWMTHKGSDTDDQGRFAIGGLPAGTYYLRAHRPGGEGYANYSDSAEVAVEVIQGGDPITLAEPLRLQGVNVGGQVVDPDGNPVCCTGVDIHTPDHSWYEGTGTGDDGRFAFGGLEPGKYVVEVHAPWGKSDWLSPAPRSFTVTDPDTPDNLNFAFTRASKHIVGRVVRAGSGEGVPHVEANGWQQDGKAWAHGETDEEGRFSIGVAGGFWEVMIHPMGGEEADWVYDGHPQKVTFSEDETTKVITFTVKSADAHVTGEVRGPDGERLAPWSVWVEVRNHQGIGNGAPLREDGTFDVPVVAGTYEVWLHVDEWQYPTWGSPEMDPIAVEEGETHDLGTLNLVTKNSFITGRVIRESDEQGVAGVDVDAWRPMAGGWAHTTTAADGSYSLAVTSGDWEIGIHIPYTSTYISGQPPQRASVGEDETVSDVNFVLQEASGSIEGLVVDENDTVLTDVYGWAYARQGMGPPVAGAPVEGGRFSIYVPSGSYWVGIGLPPESNYTPAGEESVDILQTGQLGAAVAALGTSQAVATAYRERTEQQVVVSAGDPVQVRITLVPNNARIVGQFREADGAPATDLQGEVFAMSGMGGAWRGTMINPDGTYELNVAAGTWNLGYWLMDEEYVNSPPPESRVTIEAGGTFIMNFTLVEADSVIKGYLKRPDGSGLNYGWAWAHRERTATSASIETGSDSKPHAGQDGYFEINVPAGEYDVGGCAPEELGFIQPEMQQVNVSPSSPANVILQFRASDGVITGRVFQNGKAAPGAWVWGWSENGAHTGGMTDPEGRYRLNVITGTVWHLGTSYRFDDATFYDTVQDYVVDMSGPTATQDMELSRSEVELPDALTVHFDASSPVFVALDDGTEINIPAGALGVTGTVKLVISPMVEELANTLTARPFGYGYSIHAFDNNNRQVTSAFNQNVTISFYYTEDELRSQGVSEDDLSPAYFSTNTHSWTKVESFMVDTESNRITAQINHFSIWAMTTGQGGGSFEVFLPVLMRSH